MTKRWFWKCRLVAKGPYVGVMTWHGAPLVEGEELDRGHRWQALVRNETTGRMILLGEPCPIEIEGMFLRNIEPTSQPNYEYLVAHAAYATAHAPHMPDAAPAEAIDFMKMKVPF